MHTTSNKNLNWLNAVLLVALTVAALPLQAVAQDQRYDQQGTQQDDPPNRVARLGYMEGSISLQPAGESEWVQAVANRPMTTGDKLWADKGSRAELQLGSAVIRLDANTGFSFLNHRAATGPRRRFRNRHTQSGVLSSSAWKLSN